MKIGMSKKIILGFIIIFLSQYVYSQLNFSEYDGSLEEPDWLFDLSLRAVLPGLPNQEGMLFVNAGLGRHFSIVPHILSPGLYIDAGIGYDWLELLSDDDSDDEKKKNEEYNYLGFNFGFRLYNLIEIGIVDIIPFIGYNFVWGQLDGRAPPFIHNPIIGVSAAVSFVGLEYCYYVPTRFSRNVAFHHWAIAAHFKF